MMKRLMLYTVLGVCLFSACQQEELGEAGIATDTAGLRLTVSASDFVPADSAAILRTALLKADKTAFQ